VTYAALTQRPVVFTEYQAKEMQGSIAFDFRQVKSEEEELDEGSMEGTPLESSTPAESDQDSQTPFWKTKEFLQQNLLEQEETPLNITPATMANNALVIAHHERNQRLRSLYAEGLATVQPGNAVNAFGEPPFTNWAQGYRETLDYIFVVEGRWEGRLLGLLRMPGRDEMGEGEPQEGRFPSDHVCEIAAVELS
jgi:RNA exonuclease NGL2